MSESLKSATKLNKGEANLHRKWSLSQNYGYASFLQKNVAENDCLNTRKPRSFFVKMAESVGGTRSNEQCRSHHRKMLKFHQSVSGILDYIEHLNSKPTNDFGLKEGEKLLEQALHFNKETSIQLIQVQDFFLAEQDSFLQQESPTVDLMF